MKRRRGKAAAKGGERNIFSTSDDPPAAAADVGAAGRRAHVGASAELEAVAVQIVEQVRVLDGLVRYRFGDNAELMGAWASARNVLGPFRPRVEPEAGGETPKAA